MEKMIVKAAKKAKELGFTHMSSVVKSVYATTYYHVNLIDDIIEKGYWEPAPKVSFRWHGRRGQTALPDKTISRQGALDLVR